MSIQIRANITISDSRLTRIAQFDERSRNYSIRELDRTRKTPRSYTWPCREVLDQGSEGACVGYAFAHELIAAPCQYQNVTNQFIREKIYWEAQKVDPWIGGSYPEASPVYEGTSVLAGVKVMKRLGFFEEYRWAFGIEDLAWAVGHCGPAILGLNWYEGMLKPFDCGSLHVTGSLVGGHAIMCRGVKAGEYFTVHNSWGPGWGKLGTAKISWNEMDRLLHEDGEAVIPLKRVSSKHLTQL